jgi:hypothetical protein
LSLDGDTFATGTTAWLCRPENRTNSATPYVADPDRFLWLQLTDDGTYTYAETTTAVAPTLFTGPALWNVAERFLSLGHIGELFRNVKVDAGSSAFTMYRTTDTRWSCGVTDIDDV